MRPWAIGGISDHIHALAKLQTSISLTRLVREVKGPSSDFMNYRLGLNGSFEWQSGVGAFHCDGRTYPASNYVNTQEEHQTCAASSQPSSWPKGPSPAAPEGGFLVY